MKWSFQRITSSGEFIPEIDGLRFVAIISVFLYHLSGFLVEKDTHVYVDGGDYSLLSSALKHGNLGVPLFFVISGLVLALPFARACFRLRSPVDIKSYYLRRLTRLEPPYILLLTIMFFGVVYVAKTLSFDESLKSYFASLFYIHNFTYTRDVFPLLNGVAWSLEIEVQFYLLAPLLASVFAINSMVRRRVMIIMLILIFTIVNVCFQLPYRSLIEYFQFFMLGFLLADLYILKSTIFPKTEYDAILGCFFFLVIWIFDKRGSEAGLERIFCNLVQMMGFFFFFYYVLLHNAISILRWKFITGIGGMCYSIYLLHFIVISAFGNRLVGYCFSSTQFINTSIYVVVLTSLVLGISSGYFLLIERPCMKDKWYKLIG